MNAFRKARLKLTFLYLLISVLLLGVSNLAAIGAERKAFHKIQLALSDRTQRPKLTSLLERRLREFDNDFIKILLTLDLILIPLSGLASYYLSTKTLKPIQEMLKREAEFTQDISHQLRTPLSTISMEIEALKRTEKEVPPKYKELFDSINEEIGRMRSSVSGLLTLVRIQNKDIESPKEHFYLKTALNQAITSLDKESKKKGIKIALKKVTNTKITGNKDQIIEVFKIVLENAIKYSNARSLVSILTKEQGQNVEIDFIDHGEGIPKNDLKNVFARFYRSKNAKATGSGLGLHIAQKVIEAHRGTILIKSRLKKGTTVSILLPVSQTS